jgi:hypothetical protein
MDDAKQENKIGGSWTDELTQQRLRISVAKCGCSDGFQVIPHILCLLFILSACALMIAMSFE